MDDTKKILIGLRKSRTHLDKVIKMVEDGNYCIDIMQQNLAVIGLLKSVHQSLMKRHLNTCFTKAMKTSDTARQQEMVGEILQVSKLVNK